ncbi:MAG TPA: Ser-Thr-rich GPI-anchored membrane family protein [Ignavibacteriaceae bacterium]|nr:Ser-Thr-rich GPI-anchored membrane family protein [Ignavibacteriaceae bacterium]
MEVYSPSYTDQFQQGEAVTIMWKNTRSIDEVNIELLKKDAPILTIQNNEKNQGSYLWQIPVDLRNSLHYQIKVSNSNNDDEFGISERFVVLREQ